jgi:amino acid transporter
MATIASTSTASEPPPQLQRRLGLLQSIALNMSNMIGVGPFITIPLLMSALNGPLSMLGWGVALVVCMADGLIWSELGAAMPGSGGTYIYLREAFGPAKWGRLMAFLFIWQFVFSGPFEIASGYVGFSQYLQYVWPGRSLFHAGFLTIDPLIIALGIFTIFCSIAASVQLGKSR